MKFQLENTGRFLISRYGDGVISVNGEDYHRNVVITAEAVIDDWYSGQAAELTLDAFAMLTDLPVAQRPEILVLGTGATHIFPPMDVMAGLKQHGISLEVMNTRAACRTYSVLVNEHRSVAVALIQIQHQAMKRFSAE